MICWWPDRSDGWGVPGAPIGSPTFSQADRQSSSRKQDRQNSLKAGTTSKSTKCSVSIGKSHQKSGNSTTSEPREHIGLHMAPGRLRAAESYSTATRSCRCEAGWHAWTVCVGRLDGELSTGGDFAWRGWLILVITLALAGDVAPTAGGISLTSTTWGTLPGTRRGRCALWPHVPLGTTSIGRIGRQPISDLSRHHTNSLSDPRPYGGMMAQIGRTRVWARGMVSVQGQLPGVRPGDTIEVLGQLGRPPTARNPGQRSLRDLERGPSPTVSVCPSSILPMCRCSGRGRRDSGHGLPRLRATCDNLLWRHLSHERHGTGRRRPCWALAKELPRDQDGVIFSYGHHPPACHLRATRPRSWPLFFHQLARTGLIRPKTDDDPDHLADLCLYALGGGPALLSSELAFLVTVVCLAQILHVRDTSL